MSENDGAHVVYGNERRWIEAEQSDSPRDPVCGKCELDLKQVAQDAAAWRGRFYVADEGFESIWFSSDDGEDEIFAATSEISDACAIARMLNAVPVLLAEVERLRSLGAEAARIAARAEVSRYDILRAEKLIAEIERKEPTP